MSINNRIPKYTVEICPGHFVYLDLPDEVSAQYASKMLTGNEDKWSSRVPVNHEDRDPILSVLSALSYLRTILNSLDRRLDRLHDDSKGLKQMIADWESTRTSLATIDRGHLLRNQNLEIKLKTEIEENKELFHRCLNYFLTMPEVKFSDSA